MNEQDQTSFFYKIAGLTLEIETKQSCGLDSLLPNFEPFRLKQVSSNPMCTVRFVEKMIVEKEKELTLLSKSSPTWGDRLRFYKADEGYIMTITAESDRNVSVMKCSSDFGESVICLAEDTQAVKQRIASWLIMVVFGQRAIDYNAILLHASVVEKDGMGYAFLGKSGTGKSTHSQLWLAHLKQTELLNDDNPLIRVMKDDRVLIYGSPWSGKTACYRNRTVPLKALVRLDQAQENRLERLKGAAAFKVVLPSCTAIRWDKERFNTMLTLLEDVIKSVDVAHLACLPDAEAAWICYNGLLSE